MEDNVKTADASSSPFAPNNARARAITDLSQLGELNERQSQTLIRIEELMKQQLAQTIKLRRSDAVRTVVTIIVAIVLVAVSVMIYMMVKDVMRELPTILANTNTLLQNANSVVIKAAEDVTQILKQVDNLDFDGINSIIRGAAEVNFNALNDSIEGLADGVNTFRTFVDALKNPFGL